MDGVKRSQPKRPKRSEVKKGEKAIPYQLIAMKPKLVLLAATLACAAPAFAQSQDTELKVQRHTYDREEKPDRANNVNEVTRGLSFTVKNTGRETAAEGEVE